MTTPPDQSKEKLGGKGPKMTQAMSSARVGFSKKAARNFASNATTTGLLQESEPYQDANVADEVPRAISEMN